MSIHAARARWASRMWSALVQRAPGKPRLVLQHAVIGKELPPAALMHDVVPDWLLRRPIHEIPVTVVPVLGAHVHGVGHVHMVVHGRAREDAMPVGRRPRLQRGVRVVARDRCRKSERTRGSHLRKGRSEREAGGGLDEYRNAGTKK